MVWQAILPFAALFATGNYLFGVSHILTRLRLADPADIASLTDQLLLPVIHDPELSLEGLQNVLNACASQDSFDFLQALNEVAMLNTLDAEKFEFLGKFSV